jgi:hypothetical protein
MYVLQIDATKDKHSLKSRMMTITYIWHKLMPLRCKRKSIETGLVVCVLKSHNGSRKVGADKKINQQYKPSKTYKVCSISCQFLVKPLETEDEKTERKKTKEFNQTKMVPHFWQA